MKNSVLFVSAVLSFLFMSGCAQRSDRLIAEDLGDKTIKISALQSINGKIDDLFSGQQPTESMIKIECEMLINAIEKLPLSDIVNNEDKLSYAGDKLSDIERACLVFSNLLVHISKKISAEKINVSLMAQLLRQSARITDFTKKIRNMALQYSEQTADTLWLSVSYNDKYLDILSKINSITFLKDTKFAKKIIEYELIDIVGILNEALDRNIYQNTLSELEYDNTALIKKFSERLSKEGIYADDKISENGAIQKFLSHIREFSTKN
jgi:hypothetical protein